MADNAPEVRHNREQSRFEADVGEGVAVAEYERQGDTLVFTHTRVPVEGQGQGVGDELARAGLEYARRAGLRVQPKCRFIASWMRRHPEYDALRVE